MNASVAFSFALSAIVMAASPAFLAASSAFLAVSPHPATSMSAAKTNTALFIREVACFRWYLSRSLVDFVLLYGCLSWFYSTWPYSSKGLEIDWCRYINIASDGVTEHAF